MPWFRIDDSFAGSPKRAMCSLTAVGLWTVAGAWCAQQLTDGFVPAHMMPMLGGRKRDAEELVRAGLWEPAQGGWQFHDWLDYQPSREQVEAERHAARERQKRARDKAKSRRESQEESRRDSREDHGGSHGPPGPTRPEVPNGTSEESNDSSGRGKRATRIPDDWKPTPEDVEWQRSKGISDLLARREAERFVNHWRAKSGKDATKTNWSLTWHNWLLKAQDYAPASSRATSTAIWDA